MNGHYNKYEIQSELPLDAQYSMQIDIIGTFPDFMRAMFKKGKGSYWVKQEKGLNEAAWLQMYLTNRHMVMVDFDGLDEFHWRSLPLKPNFVSFNPENGNHQCYWLLKDPVHCHKEAKRNKPYKYLRMIEKAIDEKYQGDKHFSRAISKNPFHPKWDTVWLHDRRHSLKDIHDGLELDLREVSGYTPISPVKSHRKAKQGNGKRNTTIFNNVRYRAYKEVSRYKAMDNITFDEWLNVVTEWCVRENVWEDVEPLPFSAVAATAKQIAKFCWYVYNPPKTDIKPKMTKEQIKEAQRNAQRITKAKQVGASEAAIKEAIAQLKAANKKPTKAGVARIVGLSRTQVSNKYSHLFD
ncbi:hypothetical protein D6L34_25185 [Vibrio parahaemolyticus]|nr:hypothetical protein [Vibrio parahaemolyticus]EGR1629867.1 hypothetical protein [Vibrio parahaemolyticus]